jgi:hypothetical protein
VADPQELTSNLQLARDHGVPIIDEPAFFVTIGIPAEVVARVSGRWAHF